MDDIPLEVSLWWFAWQCGEEGYSYLVVGIGLGQGWWAQLDRSDPLHVWEAEKSFELSVCILLVPGLFGLALFAPRGGGVNGKPC